jgi:hypothetical protein
MSRHNTSDGVLKIIVGMKLEVGVSMSEIRGLIDKYASDQRRPGEPGEIAGFLSVEDIPQQLRHDFSAALSSLSGPQNYRHAPRTLSASDIWG